MNKLTFSPVTRLSGLLSVEVFLEGKTVVDARVKGDQFRGFESMLSGRAITDAPYFTQRICGICSMAHGVVSSVLVEGLLGITSSPQSALLRRIMLGLEFLQNHIRHFYVFVLPDYIKLPPDVLKQAKTPDRRFNDKFNSKLVEHYLAAFAIPPLAHEALALFGGKIPHQHGLIPGGVVVSPTSDKIMHAIGLVEQVNAFITDFLVPDTELLAKYYQDYFSVGLSPARFLSFGLFPGADEFCSPEGIIMDGVPIPYIEPTVIKEDITYSWYAAQAEADLSPKSSPEPNPYKEQGYTFVKAVHYQGCPLEVGPLARQTIREGYHGHQPSTMARIVARSKEAQLVAELVLSWLSQLHPDHESVSLPAEPTRSEYISAQDVPRGALLHFAEVAENKFRRYGIITPTAWNFSPLNSHELHGPAEQALIGTTLAEPTSPVELGRIIRAFDPCLSCATHLAVKRQ